MDASEEFLAKYPPDIQAITNRLRTVVMRGAPGVREGLYARDNQFAYSFSGRYSERIVYLVPMKDYVRLGFFWGGYLPDPEHLLVGEGKRLRHIKVTSIKQAGRPALKALVKAAWSDAKVNRTQTLDA